MSNGNSEYYKNDVQYLAEAYAQLSAKNKTWVDASSARESERLEEVFRTELHRSNGFANCVKRNRKLNLLLAMRRQLQQDSNPVPFVENSDGRHPGMVFIPKVKFRPGITTGLLGREECAEEVIVPAFWIDTAPVSNVEFESVVSAHARDSHSPDDDSPVTCVNWFESHKYCAGVGKRLPTRIEWELAARGPNDYLFSVLAEFSQHDIVVWPASGTAPPHGWPVTDWGLVHMAGNVWEWTWEIFRHDISAKACSFYSLTRGGSWRHCQLSTRVVSELAIDPIHRADNIGFRCVIPYSAE